MGKRGPARTPLRVLKARGSPVASAREKKRKTTRQEVAKQGKPRKPPWVCGESVAIWERVTAVLQAAKVLSASDVDAIGRYCCNLARWRRAWKVLEEQGEKYQERKAKTTRRVSDGELVEEVIEEFGPWHVRPEVRICKQLETDCRAFEKSFGLTPESRFRLKNEDGWNIEEEADNDEDDEFFKGRTDNRRSS